MCTCTVVLCIPFWFNCACLHVFLSVFLLCECVRLRASEVRTLVRSHSPNMHQKIILWPAGGAMPVSGCNIIIVFNGLFRQIIQLLWLYDTFTIARCGLIWKYSCLHAQKADKWQAEPVRYCGFYAYEKPAVDGVEGRLVYSCIPYRGNVCICTTWWKGLITSSQDYLYPKPLPNACNHSTTSQTLILCLVKIIIVRGNPGRGHPGNIQEFIDQGRPWQSEWASID